ncbi:hypothetical protein HMPREF3145_00375 [Corynebacterium sp. HMSC05C01]|uniref:S-adenosylmethionine synthetase N-terminal domain-containing protein n=1 Tax=Corynebacterium sp. HMSC05C01 TaxID=1581113 RepID=UPI0008A4D4FD|nr:S-adenosylmethionine synthetase N-terminal domain-containing protein [Corynebacterium sp. HMSC05C01]OFT72839.1 hypothetical protein HMPREF3145_00375 [Corynebacterium sp. HMSC05C01]
MPTVRTGESTCIGHPDKLCDLIADTILDDLLVTDPAARCAVEVMATKGRIIVAGENTSTARARVRVRESLRRAVICAGYSPAGWKVTVHTHTQFPVIAAGVSTSLEARDGNESAFVLTGAGDQGTVYGYATAETRERLPLLVIAHDICKRLDTARVDGVIRGIGSDGKSQVFLRYDDDGHATDVEAVVVSIQHTKDTDLEELRRQVTNLITPAFVSTVTTFDPG